MTEEEAKTKWCPFALQIWKAADNNDLSMNRDGTGVPTAFCLGSACMAWRWSAFAEGEEHAGNVHGYCGLAGK